MILFSRTFFCKSFLSLVEIVSVSFFLSDFFEMSWFFHYWNTAVAVGVVFLIFKRTGFQTKFNIITFLTIWILFVCNQSFTWAIKTFPLDDPEQVVLTLQMPTDGFVFIFVKTFILKILLSCLFVSFFISILIEPLIQNIKKKRIFVVVTFVFFLASCVLTVYNNIPINLYRDYFSDDTLILQKSEFFQKNFVNIDSVSIQQDFPKTRNLILIIMESIENSFVDSALGGSQYENLIQELMPEDSNEFHFSNNNLIGGGFNSRGADLTISATIAKTTGCPLLFTRYFGDTLLERVSSDFDILQRNGYHNVFIQGTDANFSGTKNFVLSHGVNTLYDMHSLKKSQDIDEKYRNFRSFEAGLTDRTVLNISKHILDTLAKNKNFSLTIATIETHFPYGFYNKNCENKPKDHSEQSLLEATIKCASKDVRDFINWVKKQSFYPNTEIVVLGDHLFMGDYLVNKDISKRRWFNLFINPKTVPLNLKREFTSFDIAPTILESVGFTIENHKMGFGVSLFSSESTLVEKINIDELNIQLNLVRKSIEYNKMIYPANVK